MTVPSVPAGFVLPDMDAFRGSYPNKNELVAAPLALTDLGNFTSYPTVLGSSAPAEPAVAGKLSVAISWRAVRNESQAWLAYVNAQDAIAWKAALSSLDEVKPLFLIAVAKNPELAGTFPGLSQMFDAGKVVAAKALATKKKATEAEAKAAKKAAAAQAAANAAAVKAAAHAAAATVTANATAAPAPTPAAKATTVSA